MEMLMDWEGVVYLHRLHEEARLCSQVPDCYTLQLPPDSSLSRQEHCRFWRVFAATSAADASYNHAKPRTNFHHRCTALYNKSRPGREHLLRMSQAR